jgi:hypothetical protein
VERTDWFSLHKRQRPAVRRWQPRCKVNAQRTVDRRRNLSRSELVFTPHPLVSLSVEVWLFLALHPESDDEGSRPFWEKILRAHGGHLGDKVLDRAAFTKGFAEGALRFWCEMT